MNVEYNSNDIRFGWIIPEKATQQSGDIKIGVWVNGTAPNTKSYILKTKEKIYTIHPGLILGSGITQPDQNWFENFVVQMDSKVSTAQGYANDAQASKTAASGSATAAAESAAASAKALEDNKAYVESQKDTFVGYNKRETDLKYANALIGSASGTERVSIEDAWEAPIPGLEIAGRSEQGADPSLDNPQEIVSTDVTAVRVTGAQLFDASLLESATVLGIKFTNNGDGSFTVDGTATGYANTYCPISLPPGTYSVSGEKNQPKFFVRISKDGLTYTDHLNSFIINGDEAWVRVFIQVSPNITVNETIWPMINAGLTTLPWKPYQSKNAPISLTEPLYGIGDVRDRIMCRDGVWGIKRRYMQLTFNGSEDEKWATSDTKETGKKRYITAVYKDVIKAESEQNVPIEILCDALKAGTSIDTWGGTECISSSPKSQIYIYMDNYSSGDVDAFKAYLASHPITAIVERTTPAWEPLPAATQTALNALTTYTGTTHVTITAGGPEPDVTMEYVQDTNVIIAGLKKLIEGLINA